jgi:hypothetical protein
MAEIGNFFVCENYINMIITGPESFSQIFFNIFGLGLRFAIYFLADLPNTLTNFKRMRLVR